MNRALLVLGLALAAECTVKSADLVLKVQVRDTDNKQVALPSGEATVENKFPQALTPTNEHLELDFRKAMQLNEREWCGQVIRIFTLQVGASNFKERTLPVQFSGVCKGYEYKVHLARTDQHTSFNKSYLNQTAIIEQKSKDAALAFLTLAWDDYSKNRNEVSTYVCYLKDKYARLLRDVCDSEGYDTCKEADQIAADILNWKDCQRWLSETPQHLR